MGLVTYRLVNALIIGMPLRVIYLFLLSLLCFLGIDECESTQALLIFFPFFFSHLHYI